MREHNDLETVEIESKFQFKKDGAVREKLHEMQSVLENLTEPGPIADILLDLVNETLSLLE